MLHPPARPAAGGAAYMYDTPGYNWRLLRVLNASHNLAYVEWDPAYEFDEVAFCEFFDLARDPWQTHNLCPALDAHLRASLSEELQRWYECRGNRSTPSNCQ